MSQSRSMSLVESITQVAISYCVAIVTQIIIYPWYDIAVSFLDQMGIAAIFVIVSICRSYLIRRLFNRL